ncbi:hypothetical protein EG68_07702 [Paragonimus skrjabini miyazakii]|uniref:Coiled-coil domain-containing protein 113 n=1 Tax=Paragonimus skrjabini miyazakii TaxID=59628 RepID=A0A8S9YBD2_9TREM|nr:hypothetical protein EG68_07702 [Paragonimus skrjabini miyazakii]
MSEGRDTVSTVKPTDYRQVESTASSLINKSRSRQLTNAERAALLDSTRMLIEVRLLENCIYERYLARIKPEFIYLIAPPISFMSAGLRKKSVRRSVAVDRLTRLTAEQRCIVAQSELEEYKKDIERLELEGRMTLDQEKTILEAANMRAEETQKCRAMFDKYVTSILDSPKERTEIENRDFDAILRFHRAYLRRMDTQLANLRIENDSLHRDCRRFNKYLRERDDYGESLDAIDLEHMKIRCQQSTYEMRRLEVVGLEVKASLVRVTQMLATQKHQLKQETAKNKKLYAELNQTENMNLKLKDEIQKNNQYWNEEQLVCDTLKRALLSYKVPDTKAYIQSVIEALKLTRQKVLLDRKKNAAQILLKRHRKIWSNLKRKQLNSS